MKKTKNKDRYTMIHNCLEKMFAATRYQMIEPIMINMDGKHENFFEFKESKRVTNVVSNHSIDYRL